ncbi:MAG: VacJ family lipoprotein [Alphaproteobacteria bacterium]|nr:VacJ family lipoprotein [Alphaproteobacteria bacterium]MBR1648613.1 VacJ family lipoprotein [Alphaproteobacteria bacterium]
MSKKKIVAVILAGLALNTSAYADDGWLETYNRGMFDFNMKADKYVLKPLAKGYRAVTTPDVRLHVRDFISNVKEPSFSANHLLQGNVDKTFVSVARFAINSTLGLGGFFDVAEGWGLKKSETGFDETLARYCVPDGPFFVAPLFGPFTIRSGVGYAVDGVSTPVYWGAMNDKNYSAKISYGFAALSAISARERGLELLDDLEQNSVDFYSTVRSAYLQNRQKMNSICASTNAAPGYDFDFDDEDYD